MQEANKKNNELLPIPDVSIIIPVYNSEKSLQDLCKRLEIVLHQNTSHYEIILINDGSTDSSWNVICQLGKLYKSVVGINLVRNYGQHNAILCGFEYAKGDYLITMDDDLQNPPEEITKLINKAKEGYDVVFGKFIEKKHSFIRRIGSKVIGYINTKVFSKPKHITLTNFRIIRRDVINRILDYKIAFPYIPGLVLMFSHKTGNVVVEHCSREIGKSNYNFLRILKLVSVLLFCYSSFPMKFLGITGSTISIISFLLGIAYIIKNIAFSVAVPGWTSVVVLMSFFCGYIIFMLSIIGEYLSRIMNQVSSNKCYYTYEVIRNEEKTL